MRLLHALFVLAVLLHASGVARSEEVRLTVLHTTDLHGALTSRDDLTDRTAARGLTRLSTMVTRVRAEAGPVLLLDAGDCIQGSPLVTVYQQGDRRRPDPMMMAMNRIGYDALAVGNHEFNFGPGPLERARREASFPFLAANIRRADGTPAFPATMVKRMNGLAVGVVGLCTPAVPFWEDSAHIAGLRFESPVRAARREIERLRTAEKCDAIVVVAHTGLGGSVTDPEPPDEDWGRRIAAEVPGIDLLVLGHSHVVVPTLEVGGALVSQAGKWGEHLGRADLTFTRGAAGAPWTLKTRTARVIAVTDTTPEDSALVALAAPYHEEAQAVLNQVIAQASEDLTSPSGRFADGPLWELIQRVQLEATGADVSLAALFDPDVRIAKGPITVRDAMRLYVYDNTLGVVELTGRQLDETLEHSARYLATYDFTHDRPLAERGRPGFNFDAAEGVSYEIDLTRPLGDRVSNLTYRGAPLDPARRLKVAVNNYRMNGGGGFEAIRTAPRVSRSGRPVRDLLIDHLRAKGSIDARYAPNWLLFPDYVTTTERPLIDRLVRENIAPRAEVHRLGAREPARRGDLAYWLARSFDWREDRRPSGAFGDVPDSLTPWLDGLLKRRVIGDLETTEEFGPFLPVPLARVLDWCENAARSAGYALPRKGPDPSFRRGLLAGIPMGPSGGLAYNDVLTRGQLLGVVSNTRFPTVRVLETTDFHGAILSRSTNPARALGGSAVLAAHIKRLTAANPEGTVLIDGGDLFQGTMISNLAFGRPVVEQMNALGYTAAAIGNHEFDWTADTLERRVRSMTFAALGANVIERKTGKRPRWVRSDTTVARRGVRIGILGLCYPETPSVTLARHVAHLRFEDDSTAAARVVPRLRKEGAEVVVAVGHIPATSDSTGKVGGDLARLARGVKGVDAWFGGHSHNRVSGEVAGVPAMVAGSHGEAVAVCDLVVDPLADKVIERRFRLQLTEASQVRPDSAMQARVERWNRDVAPIAAEPLGRNLGRLTRARSTESLVGNLVADAMRLRTGAGIALQNSGGLRADLPEGVVTRGSIYEVLPFENTVVTMDLTGEEVKRALEEALRFERVTQVSGIRYVFDLGAPDFDRVRSLTDSTGTPLDLTRVYKVATNNFMAEGGDSYETLARGRNRVDSGVPLRDLLEQFVRERSKDGGGIDYKPDGRVARASGSKPPARD